MGIMDVLGGMFGGGGDSSRIGAQRLMEMLEAAQQAVCLVDVRSPDEFKSGHIPGSVSVPLGTLSGLDSFPFKGRIVLCCASGIRSVKARNILSARGIEAVDLKGGVKAWVGAGGSLTMG